MKSGICLTFLALTFVGSSFADDVLVTGGSWYAGETPSNSGSAFWDGQQSADGPGCGIGFVLTGAAAAAGCSNVAGLNDTVPNIPGGTVTPSFLAAGSSLGGTATAFSFTGDSTNNTGFVASIAGDTSSGTSSETFGWVDTTPGHAGNGGALISVSNKLVTTIGGGTFNPGTDSFYFYLTVNTGTPVTYDSNVLGNGNTSQFALFAGTAGTTTGVAANSTSLSDFWLGMEDSVGGDNDYNDLVVQVSALGSNQNTPEPGFYGLLALGMVGVALFARRRQRKILA